MHEPHSSGVRRITHFVCVEVVMQCKLDGCEDDFVLLVWPSRGKLFHMKKSVELVLPAVKSSCPPAESINETRAATWLYIFQYEFIPLMLHTDIYLCVISQVESPRIAWSFPLSLRVIPIVSRPQPVTKKWVKSTFSWRVVIFEESKMPLQHNAFV